MEVNMRTILAIFRSRSETLSFANILKSYGVGVSIISTPRSAKFLVEFLQVFQQADLIMQEILLQEEISFRSQVSLKLCRWLITT